jgi:protein O-GlcNAc transferase
MTLLSEEQKKKLQKLYHENKFSELELEIESISEFKTRSPFLANLLGVAKLKKRAKTEKDWIDAKNLFLDSYTKAPDYDDALCNYAHISVKLRDYGHAFQQLMNRSKKGYSPKVNEALARIYFFEGEIDKEVELFKENEKNGDLTSLHASHLLCSMNYSSNFNQQNYLEYCKKIDEKFSIPSEEIDKLKHYNFDNSIKVGFISPDFKEHSVYYFLKSTLDSLKENSIKITAFNLRKREELDDISKEIESECDEWIDLSEMSDFNAANLIIEKKINILIDLTGHFARNRFKILKYKPSPIQITWMGYVNTTGIKEVDYIIVDHNLIKPDEENLYSEKVLRLPNIWNSHIGISNKLLVNELPFIKNQYITFGCFNNSSKISENCINTWSKILSKIDKSKLIIKASSKDSEMAQKKILDKFKFNNVNEKRIIFESHKKNRNDHLKMYNLVDISLDTFPYPGVTTSFESIWMGVPVLTKKGNNFTSRCGESININLGMIEMIARDEEDYLLKAIKLSKNIEYLSETRKTLREKANKSPLFDSKSFGKDFTKLIMSIWENYISKN